MSAVTVLLTILLMLAAPHAGAGAQKGPCDQGVCTLSQIEAYAKSLGIDWSFELDGCDARARTVALGLNQDLAVTAGTVRYDGGASLASRFIPWSPEISWGHHTAAYVQLAGDTYILDFTLFDRAVPVQAWREKLGGPSGSPATLKFETASQLEWMDFEFERLSEAKRIAPRFSFLALPAPNAELRVAAKALWAAQFFKQHVSDVGSFYGDDFALRDIFKSRQQAMQALSQSTRCASRRDGSSNCTAYLQIESQTCYFKFDVQPKAPAPLAIEGDRELICF